MDIQSELYSQTLTKLSDLYEVIAKKHNVTPELVERIIQYNFQYIGAHIRKRKTDPILIHNFGSFYMSHIMVDHIIRGLIKGYKNGNVTREKLKEELTVLFKIRREFKQK